MTATEQVTDFKLEDAAGKPILLTDLLRALEAHLNANDATKLDGERFACLASWPGTDLDMYMPVRYRWLIAFHVEGENEADYVHLGAIIQPQKAAEKTEYLDFGFAKLWNGAAQARAVANEAARFLAAARWN